MALPPLVLPSLGFVLHSDGCISEVTCNGPSPPVPSKLSFSARSASTRPRASLRGRSSKVFRGEQILGIAHSTPLCNHEKEQPENGQTQVSTKEDQIDACLKLAAEGESIRMAMAFENMKFYLETLKPGSLVLEVGSRAGDMVLRFAEHFQDLYILPTEGIGEASPSLFVLLQERLAQRQKPKKKPKWGETVPRSRILPPRHLDGASLKSWRSKLTNQEISRIFCVNVLHYVSPTGLENFLQGCSENLVMGGELLLCGPFFNNGQATDSLLVYDAALREFSAERMLHWGCHDLTQVVAIGKKLGLSLVAHHDTDSVGGHSWMLIVLRKERLTSRSEREDVEAPLGRWRSSTTTGSIGSIGSSAR